MDIVNKLRKISREPKSRTIKKLNGGTNLLVDGTNAMLALAVRPVESDRAGLLFSYNLSKAQRQTGLVSPLQGSSPSLACEQLGTLSADAYIEPVRRLEIAGRVAMSDRAIRYAGESRLATTSYLFQSRIHWRVWKRFDIATEGLLTLQPVNRSRHIRKAAETGFWLSSGLRLAAGYGFRSSGFGDDVRAGLKRNSPYIVFTMKTSMLFNLFRKDDSAPVATVPQP